MPVCPTCNEFIVGPCLQAGDKSYHPDHFKCDTCKNPLQGQVFEVGNKPICQSCFQRNHSSQCARCNMPITGQSIRALERKWHTDCFTCSKCKTQLYGAKFTEKNGLPYCSTCAVLPKSASVRRPLPKHPTAPGSAPQFPEPKPITPQFPGGQREGSAPQMRRNLPPPPNQAQIPTTISTSGTQIRELGARRAAPTRPKSATILKADIIHQNQNQGDQPPLPPRLAQPPVSLKSQSQNELSNRGIQHSVSSAEIITQSNSGGGSRRAPPIPQKPKIALNVAPAQSTTDLVFRADDKGVGSPRRRSTSILSFNSTPTSSLPVEREKFSFGGSDKKSKRSKSPSKGPSPSGSVEIENPAMIVIEDMIYHLPWFKDQWENESEESRAQMINMINEDLKRGQSSRPAIQVKSWTKSLTNLNVTLSATDVLRAKAVSIPLKDSINRLLRSAHESVNVNNPVLIKRHSSTLSEATKRGFLCLLDLLDVLGSNTTIEVLKNVINSTVEKITKMSYQVEPNKDILLAASESLKINSIHNLVVENIRNSTEEISSSTSQLLSTLESQPDDGLMLHRTMLQLISFASNLIDLCKGLLQGVVTMLALADYRNNCTKDTKKQLNQLRNSCPDLRENIWDCKPAPDHWPDNSGTLNTLVLTLTSPDSFSVPFQKSFITTFRSFTTPEILFAKLVQRYNPPKGIPTSDLKQIQIRICIVLKYWFETRIRDFDDDLSKELDHFINVTVKDNGKGDLSEMLRNALDQARAKDNVRASMPLIQVVVHPISPSDLIMNTPAKDIAEQLTLISSAIFMSTNINELLNLAWSKPKTRHMSPHVIASIRRFNQFSFWVPTVILSFESLRERSQAINKFIEIGKELRALQNFDGIMGVVAGMTMSSVDRLKFSKLSISDPLLDSFTKLVECMAPDHSWKIYRETLHACTPPAVPYLGTYLTDLTFIEDGNANYFQVDGKELINFRKCELLYKVLQEVQVYQTCKYPIEPKEPLLSYLRYLPHLDEAELYSISLLREPRGASMKDLLT